MTWIMKLYMLALKLYPRPFRERFAHEMEEVFRAGLEEALEQDAAAAYVLREALRLPGNLADVYAWSARAGKGGQMAISNTAGGGTIGGPVPGEGWGGSLLAGLPNLVMGIIMVSSTLIGEVKDVDQNTFGKLQLAGMGLLLLGVLSFSIYTGWQRWSASWLAYLFIFAVILASLAANFLASTVTGSDGWVYGAQTMTFPLLMAYLLYKIAGKDRLRGLLAAIPPMVWLWSYFQEFVPALPKSLAWGWLFLLAFGASVLILRTRRFAAALGLALAVPALGGLPFVYLGVYMGGTLPFSEPGPSLLEVWRQYLPFLAAVSSIALGPQLAVKLRAFGYESTEACGKIFYRLALGGILLGLILTLIQWVVTSGGTPRWMHFLLATRPIWLVTAVVLYLSGFLSLVSATIRSGTLGRDGLDALRLAALFILLPGVPMVIFLAMPNSALSGYPNGWLFSAAEVVWMCAAAWTVMHPKPD